MSRSRLLRGGLAVLDQASVLLFGVVLLVFALLSPRFLTVDNLTNVLVQSSSVGVVAVGMTFVLLTAGVDLSVGAIMFVAAAVAGKCVLGGLSTPLVLVAMLLVGVVFGSVNALLVTRLRVIAFVATLGMLYVGRGFSLWLTETRAMNVQAEFLPINTTRLLGVPMPVWVFGAVLVVAHLVLSRTPYGRQLYAVGQDAVAARKAGVRVNWILASVYIISGWCAAVGAVLSLGQLGTVSPTFGLNREFTAIAAAVLGGTSLFGGRGRVLPGTLLGAVLMQSVENGLVIVNANEYLYPLIMSGVIFVAVAVDSGRSLLLTRLTRRPIRMEEP